MAAAVLASLLLFLGSTLPSSLMGAAQTRVSISSPTSPVTVGGILAIQCQIWDTQHDYKVSIYRISNGRTVQITNGEDIARPSEQRNVFLAARAFSGGSFVYFVTMVDVDISKQGEYMCRVLDITKFTLIAEDSINIELYSLPSNGYPICNSIPNQPITVNIGDRLTLKCTSEKGIPTMQIKWINTNSAGYLTTYETIEDNLIHSEVITDITEFLHGALFHCEITSNGFPDWKRTCVIGPITVKSQFENINDNVNNQQIVNIDKGIHDINKGMINLSKNCKKCSSNSDKMEFYLTVATFGTGLLTIIFLVTTIIMCRRYHTISEQTRRQPARVLTSQQSVEPVYVSLQRRPQSTYSEREYMTLEDPNNPENKIILPKETFDDYCRTMSLKRV